MKTENTHTETGRDRKEGRRAAFSSHSFSCCASHSPVPLRGAYFHYFQNSLIAMSEFQHPYGGQPPHQYGNQGPPSFYSRPHAHDGNDGYGGGPGQPNFLGGISPEMLNMGLSAGKNMLSAQRDQWLPGLSTFFTAIKIYFAVLFRSCQLFLCPIILHIFSSLGKQLLCCEEAKCSSSPISQSKVEPLASR